MPFNSETGKLAGQKSVRGKDKVGSELRNKLKDLADHLIDTIDIHSLNNSERIALLRILVSYTIPKLSIEEHINSSPSEMTIKFVDSNDNLIRKDHHIYD